MDRHAKITEASLARTGAVSAVSGAIVLAVSTLLHPFEADPNDAAGAFAEYAADALWVWSHLGQFLGTVLLAVGLIAVSYTLEPGRAAAWGRVGLVGTAATIATAAALQAVDGVALKVMVDRWASADGAARELAFEAAFAVRQIEIGLAAFLPIVFGLTLAAISMGLLNSARYPRRLGALGFAGAAMMAGTGLAHATTGFSGAAMMLSMFSSLLLVAWFALAAASLWMLGPALAQSSGAPEAAPGAG